MNRNDCDIARDLMPLSVDGVCSEGSQRFLDDHVAQCPPCRDTFAQMKAGIPSLQPEPDQEAAALKQGLRYLGKRFKALWITLMVLVCAFVLLLVAAGVNQMLMIHTAATPLDAYTVRLYRNDALVSMQLSGSFYKQVYNGFKRTDEPTFLPDSNQGALILTYELSWYPYQHKKIADSLEEADANGLTPFKPQGARADVIYDGAKLNTSWKSDYRFTTSLDDNQLCMEDGRLYLIGGMDAAKSTAGRTLLVLLPGMPVAEIRFTDGKNTETIYTWGDEIENVWDNRSNENALPESGILSPSDLDKYADLIVK